jgi:hypothetical protein
VIEQVNEGRGAYVVLPSQKVPNTLLKNQMMKGRLRSTFDSPRFGNGGISQFESDFNQ